MVGTRVRRVSIDLAVWEGPQPASDKEAAATFEALYDRYVARDDTTPPTARITAYVDALLARFPDFTELDDDAMDDNPWADAPLISNAIGPFMYFGMVRSATFDEAWSHAVSTARSMDLVCFDPQSLRLAS